MIAFLKSKKLDIQNFRFEPEGLKLGLQEEVQVFNFRNNIIMKIVDFNIGKNKVFVIAEIGNNHNGSFNQAIKMIDAAIDVDADCVKFQMRNMESVYRKKSLKTGEDLELSTF